MKIGIGSHTFRVEILVLIIFVFWILSAHMVYGCSSFSFADLAVWFRSFLRWLINGSTFEGFVGANNKVMAGPQFADNDSPYYIMKPDTWGNPTLVSSPGAQATAGAQSIWDRPKQPIPLPSGQLDMFATTQFKPECCPNAFSTSTGCACMTVDQFNYLQNRGGNNVPFSQF